MNDDLYFICNIKDFKILDKMIQNISLPLRDRYVYCCAPVNWMQPFVCDMFTKVKKKIFTFQINYHSIIYCSKSNFFALNGLPLLTF